MQWRESSSRTELLALKPPHDRRRCDLVRYSSARGVARWDESRATLQDIACRLIQGREAAAVNDIAVADEAAGIDG